MEFKKCAAFFIAAGLAFSSAGCAAKQQAGPDAAYSDELHMVAGMEMRASSQNGYYEIRNLGEGAGNIVYTDYATEQSVYLCANPNCAHTNETCSSWVQNDGWGDYLFMGPEQKELYYVSIGSPEDNGRSCVWVMEPDGGNRRLLAELPAKGRVNYQAAADSRYLYFFMTVGEQSVLKPDCQLVRVDRQNGEVTVLVKGLAYDEVNLVGAFGSTLVLQNDHDEQMDYEGYDLKTGKFTEFASFDYDSFSGFTALEGSRLFLLEHLKDKTGRLTMWDFTDGSKKVVEDVPCTASEDGTALGYVMLTYGDHLLFEYLDNAAEDIVRCLYDIDVETGTIHKIDLTYNKWLDTPYPVWVLAEAGDDFLVVSDVVSAAVNSMEEGVVTRRQVDDLQVKALIAKEDFYQNRPDYRIIKDCTILE